MCGKVEKGKKDTALVLIDIQDFYFSAGGGRLDDPEKASLNAKEVLKKFRQLKQLVIHVKHKTRKGGNIYKDVAPVKGEKVIIKTQVNAFMETDLLKVLKENKTKSIVFCGMMTHMCLEGAVRAARDYGFDCIIIGDACATRDLKYGDRVVKAEDVHNATLATLNRYYGKVTDTKTFLEKY